MINRTHAAAVIVKTNLSRIHHGVTAAVHGDVAVVSTTLAGSDVAIPAYVITAQPGGRVAITSTAGTGTEVFPGQSLSALSAGIRGLLAAGF